MNDDASPVTRGDLKGLATKQDLQDLRSDLEQKMSVMGQDLERKMAVMQQETMHYITLGFETIRHDFFSVDRDEKTAIKEKHSALEKRVGRIEDALGMAA